MAQDDEEQATSAGSAAPALAHSRLHWEAEVENARRLANRGNGILTLIVAALGLALARLGSLNAMGPQNLSIPLRGLLGVGLMLVIAALWAILQPRTRSRARPLASSHLSWPAARRFHPSGLSAGTVDLIAYERTVRAALELHRRNARRQAEIDRGQNLLLLAAASAGLAILWYLWMAGPAGRPDPGLPQPRPSAEERK